jgi:hypothetical protein
MEINESLKRNVCFHSLIHLLSISIQEVCKSTTESVKLTLGSYRFNGGFNKTKDGQELCRRMTPNTSQV